MPSRLPHEASTTWRAGTEPWASIQSRRRRPWAGNGLAISSQSPFCVRPIICASVRLPRHKLFPFRSQKSFSFAPKEAIRLHTNGYDFRFLFFSLITCDFPPAHHRGCCRAGSSREGEDDLTRWRHSAGCTLIELTKLFLCLVSDSNQFYRSWLSRRFSNVSHINGFESGRDAQGTRHRPLRCPGSGARPFLVLANFAV
jgi:hypothetical protein